MDCGRETKADEDDDEAAAEATGSIMTPRSAAGAEEAAAETVSVLMADQDQSDLLADIGDPDDDAERSSLPALRVPPPAVVRRDMPRAVAPRPGWLR